ncbi:MAG: GTPase, partial [Syntrophales bacterium]
MPANLPPHYFEAEQRFRQAKTPEDKIEALEEMLAIMPKHKGTDKLKAMLRERISKLKDQAQKKKGATRQKTAYDIEKEGAAQIVIIGPPNTGKSSLVKLITNASPEVADF